MTSNVEIIEIDAQFLSNTLASDQVWFDPTRNLRADEGGVFITDVADAPLQVIGRLGEDGKWYIGSFFVDWGGRKASDFDDVIILRDEIVAARMIVQCTITALADPSFLSCADFAIFQERLARSERFVVRQRHAEGLH